MEFGDNNILAQNTRLTNHQIYLDLDHINPMLKDLQDLQANSEFLTQLEDTDLASLADVLQENSFVAGDTIFEIGGSGDRVYLLLEGHVSLEGPAQPGQAPRFEERRPGQLVGVQGFASGDSYERTARCTKDSRLATLDRDHFNKLLKHSPESWRKLEVMALQRMREAQLAKNLDRIFGPFGQLLPFVMQEVAEHSDWLSLQSGETLYNTGDEADGAFVLLAGRLAVTERHDAGEKLISTVLPGETIGEVALLSERQRTTTVYAARDSELVKLSRHIFELMLQRSARATYRVSSILINRLVHRRSENEAERMPIRNISLIKAGSNIPLQELTSGLQTYLARYGQIKLLTQDLVADELGLPGVAQATERDPAHLRLTDWLQNQEDHFRYLIYCGSDTWTPWTQRCVRQADRLVVVADATADQDLLAINQKVSGPRRRWSLVLLHPAETRRPSVTSRWLEGIDADSVYHVRRGNINDLERLARILSGHAVGLVMGGGGARGFAHLGVLKALEELGVPVDMVGGASIGAPVAGWVAQGRSAEDAMGLAREAFHKLIDLTLPLTSMIAGKRISRSIYKQTETWDIEDYWLPFFCMSSNITTAHQVIHRRGNSARAIRTSVSLPGILPPVPEGESLLVDGGVLNNLPIDVMREMNPFGQVIAIDVAPPVGPKARIDHGTWVSGWRQLLDRINPFRKARPLPAAGAVIMQSMMVGSALARKRALEQNLADFYINIHVRGVGLLDFTKIAESAEIGYQQSIGPLREWAEQQELGSTQTDTDDDNE